VQYGAAVQAGLPNITGTISNLDVPPALSSSGAFTHVYKATPGATLNSGNWHTDVTLDASRSSAVYGRSTTVTPSHVKYPWVIVVYNAAVPASVAEAGEFVGMLDGKADKAQVASAEAIDAEGRARIVGWGMPDYTAGVNMGLSTTENSFACPSAGIVVIETAGFNNVYAYLRINGVVMFNKTSNANSYNAVGMGVWPVSKGDVCVYKSGYTHTFAGTHTAIFYPLVGTKV